MKKFIITLLTVLSVGCANANNPQNKQRQFVEQIENKETKPQLQQHPDIENLHDLIKRKEYNEAYLFLNSISIPQYSRTGWKNNYDKILKTMQTVDETITFSTNVIAWPENYISAYRSIRKNNCRGSECKIAAINESFIVPEAFGPQMTAYLQERRKKGLEAYARAEQALAQYTQIQETRRKEEQRQAQARIDKNNQQKKDRHNALIYSYNEKSLNRGFKGYIDTSISRLILSTQQEGGLEKHINAVVGCHKMSGSKCRRYDKRITVFQAVDNAVLLNFSEYINGRHYSFTIWLDAEPGKIYQNGQALENVFYLFKGMKQYVTATGASSQVPHFVRIEL